MNARQFLITEDMVLLEDEKAHILTMEELEELLTDFAKHKAHECYTVSQLCNSEEDHEENEEWFEKWWEENI